VDSISSPIINKRRHNDGAKELFSHINYKIKYYLEIWCFSHGIIISIFILVIFSNPAARLALFFISPGITELSRKLVDILSKYCSLFSLILTKNFDIFGPYFGNLRPKKLPNVIIGK